MPIKIFADNPHMPYLDNPRPAIITQLDFGDVIIFTYNKKDRMVFVLAGNYEGKLHGFDMNEIGRGDLISVVVPAMYKTDDPYKFYHSMPGIKSVVKQTDSYRSYDVKLVKNITRCSYDAKPKGKK
jgi:hypothetical protein